MQPFTVKYHPPGAAAPPSAFFILSRGRHTGRPAYSPNPNCFVFTCAPQDLHRYYWLVYALWLSRKFEPFLCGSVIEFIHIGDLAKVPFGGKENSKATGFDPDGPQDAFTGCLTPCSHSLT
jgi:hypothetical protein